MIQLVRLGRLLAAMFIVFGIAAVIDFGGALWFFVRRGNDNFRSLKGFIRGKR
jgi:hypothetical protein